MTIHDGSKGLEVTIHDGSKGLEVTINDASKGLEVTIHDGSAIVCLFFLVFLTPHQNGNKFNAVVYWACADRNIRF